MLKKMPGTLCTLIAACLFALGGLLMKLIPWHGLAINSFRSAIAFWIILLFLKRTGHRIVVNRSVMTGAACMVLTNLLYSMAKENVLPGWFGELHPVYKTPKNAILFVMCIAIIAPFFGRTALGWIVDMSSLGAAIGYGYTSLAAVKYARKEGNTGVTITGMIGAIMGLMFCILLLVPIKLFGCSLGKESMICLVIWIVMGIIFYVTTRGKRNAKQQ